MNRLTKILLAGFLINFGLNAIQPALAVPVANQDGRGRMPQHVSKAGFQPLKDDAVALQEGDQLESILAGSANALASIPAGSDATSERRKVEDQLNDNLEAFVRANSNSAWTPSLRLNLARKNKMHGSYSAAMDHYRKAWAVMKNSTDAASLHMRAEASAGLAKLLMLTGRGDEFDALEKEVRQSGETMFWHNEWSWAKEMRVWTRKHPKESYKCGLYCLDQLGRATELGRFKQQDITETESSTNGFTAAELVKIGSQAGLHVEAAILRDFDNLPIPCVVHLAVEHFIVVLEKRGSFYLVYDPVAYGNRWLTATDIAKEATGCILVNADTLTNSSQLTKLNMAAAQSYRGRCHGPLPWDHEDNPCLQTSDCTKCPPGNSGPESGGNGNGDGRNGGNGCNTCSNGGGGGLKGDNFKEGSFPGMPSWFVSDPYINLWVTDMPLQYKPAIGPSVDLVLSYNNRRTANIFTYWHGGGFQISSSIGIWSCSWLTFADMDSSENTIDLMLPASGWTTFDFPVGSNVSSMNYRHNLWLEKQGPAGGVTNLVLHYANGSVANYGVLDTSMAFDGYSGTYYISSLADPTGQKLTYTYDQNYYLTNLTAADGTTFTLQYDQRDYEKNCITNITSSYGATVSFGYLYADGFYNAVLTNITDAAQISSQIAYQDLFSGSVSQLKTPYGTTTFDTADSSNEQNGIFDRMVRITKPDGTQEFYASMNQYYGTDWPDFAISQIPTNTPLGTLDTNAVGRLERNTFYWNAQQFASYINTSYYDFNWNAFRTARIRHWLTSTYQTYTHFDTLSVEQAPSPDGTTEGQLTWYDYEGKPSGINYERGSQIMPAVIARVMPDGSTWYQKFERLANGKITKDVEKWQSGGTALYRTNTYVYAPNNIDRVAWTNALNIRVYSNVFNAYHLITTNYDALNQITTFSYDLATLQLTNSVLPSGLTNICTYGADHRLQQEAAPAINAVSSFTWSNGNVFTYTDERGLKVTNYWDGLNRLIATVYPDGTSISNFYNRFDNTPYPNSSGGTNLIDLTATKDRMNHWTYFEYDSLRRHIATTNANKVVTLYGYCDCGALTSITNAFGAVEQAITQFIYDYQSRKTQTILADGTTVTNTYDPLGRVTIVSDAYGKTTNTFDNLSRLIVVSNYVGRLQSTIFDPIDRETNTVDANGVFVNRVYDVLNRVLSRSFPDGGVERFIHSSRGVIAYTNQIGEWTLCAYDEAHRKIAETNANTEFTLFSYAPSGDLLTLTDGKNQVTRWNYDIYGNVSNRVDAANRVTLYFNYDADNRFTNRWSLEKSNNTYYAYDAVGNLTNVTYPVSPGIKLSYDALNRLTNMIDASGTNKFTYTAVGKLLTEDGPWANDTITYGYTARQRTSLSLQQPSGPNWTQSYSYDGAKRLTNVTSSAGPFNYQYGTGQPNSPALLVQKLLLPNGAAITNAYGTDGMARWTQTVLRSSSGALLNSHGYVYDLANERTNQIRVDGSYVNYQYDNIGQLTSAVGFESNGTPRLNETFGYVYDKAHNLSNRVNNTLVQTFNVNSLNELTTVTRNTTNALTVIGTTSSSATSVTINDGTTYKGASLYGDATFASTNGFTPVDGNNVYSATASDSLGRTNTGTVSAYLPASASYTYDQNGNLLNDGKRFFEYDDENQLTAVTVSNVWRSEFTYDGKSRRRTRKEFTWQASVWSQTNIVYYVYAGNLVIQERDANNQPLVTYTRGIDLSRTLQKAGGIGGLLARSDNATQRTAFYHADGNGNVTALINAQQILVAKYLYDPFGNILSKSGPLADSNLYCFSSKEYHPNSGLNYYLYRFYEPKLQRWLSSDPIGEEGGFNLSCFIKNRPLMKVDVWGLEYVDYDSFGGVDSSGNFPPKGQPRVPSKGNCWRYACNDPTDDSGYHNTAPPGWTTDPTCAGLLKGIRDAGAIDPEPCGDCRPGYHKIRVQFSEDANKGTVPDDWPKVRDFHFIKQLPDGRWAHKNANAIPEITTENMLLPNYTKCGDNALCIPDHVDTKKLSK